MPEHASRTLGGHLTVALGAVLVSLFLFEGSLRLFPPGISDRLFQEDDRFGWFHIPGRQGWYRSSELSVLITINSRGLRDVEHAYDKAEGTCRLLIVGDSFAEGMQVPLQDTVGRQLEAILNGPRGPAFEVINGGVAGFGTDRELLFYRAEGRLYHPDVVLLFFSRNDAMDNARSPFFSLEGGRLEGHQPAPGAFSRSGAEIRAWLWDQSISVRLAGLAWTRLRDLVRPLPQPAGVPDPVYRVPPPADIEAAWDLTAALLKDLRDAVAEDGARLILVEVPDVHSLGELHPQPGYSMDQVSARLGRVTSDLAVPFLDLRPAFVSQVERDPSTTFYWPSDEHWNSAVHRLAAMILAEQLTQGAAALSAAEPGVAELVRTACR